MPGLIFLQMRLSALAKCPAPLYYEKKKRGPGAGVRLCRLPRRRAAARRRAGPMQNIFKMLKKQRRPCRYIGAGRKSAGRPAARQRLGATPRTPIKRPRPHGGACGEGGGARRGTMTQQEFTALISQYEKLVYTICRQFVGDDALAEDLAQETFLSAWMHRDDCPPGSYKPWLARIAANKAKDHLKSAYHRRVHAEEDEKLPILAGADPAQGPEQQALAKDGAARIEADIRALKEPYHLVSVAYFLEQKPPEQIAQELGRPVKTVHTQLARARRMLQQKLQERGMQDGAVL